MESAFYRGLGAALSSWRLWFTSQDPARYYEYLGDDVVEGRHAGFSDPNKPLWLNLGYWGTEPLHYPEAAAALAGRLGEAAALCAQDALLDVGFGFAEQDLFWLERFGVRHITGVNITQMQVDRARKRVEERGLSSRIDLRHGSATELPFEAASFDKVTALECAHHFDTREQFFREAFRVLKPGGRLATADATSTAGDRKPNFFTKLALRRWSVPLANVYDRDAYCEKLRAIGFVNVSCESICGHVFPGCLAYQALRNRGVSMADAVVTLSQADIDTKKGRDLFGLTGLSDYVIFKADKPQAMAP